MQLHIAQRVLDSSMFAPSWQPGLCPRQSRWNTLACILPQRGWPANDYIHHDLQLASGSPGLRRHGSRSAPSPCSFATRRSKTSGKAPEHLLATRHARRSGAGGACGSGSIRRLGFRLHQLGCCLHRVSSRHSCQHRSVRARRADAGPGGSIRCGPTH